MSASGTTPASHQQKVPTDSFVHRHRLTGCASAGCVGVMPKPSPRDGQALFLASTEVLQMVLLPRLSAVEIFRAQVHAARR